MARQGRRNNEIPYRRNRLPERFQHGRKFEDQYGGWTYEDLLVPDDFGNLYDPKMHDPDIDFMKRWR